MFENLIIIINIKNIWSNKCHSRSKVLLSCIRFTSQGMHNTACHHDISFLHCLSPYLSATVFPVSMPTGPRPCDYTHGVFKRESCETHTRSKPKVQFMELTTLFVCERELTCDRVRVHVWKLSLSIRYGHTIPLCMWRTWTCLCCYCCFCW